MATTFYVKKNDLPATISGICKDADGKPVSLAAVSTVKFQMRLPGASAAKVNAAASVVAAVAFTAAVTDLITANSHGLVDGDAIMFSNSGGALPAGLDVFTKYYVIQATTNTFKVSLSASGSAVNITDTGTGTHTIVSGKWSYTWIAADLDTAGKYNAAVQVTFSNGKIETFPSRDHNVVVVGEELA